MSTYEDHLKMMMSTYEDHCNELFTHMLRFARERNLPQADMIDILVTFIGRTLAITEEKPKKADYIINVKLNWELKNSLDRIKWRLENNEPSIVHFLEDEPRIQIMGKKSGEQQ